MYSCREAHNTQQGKHVLGLYYAGVGVLCTLECAIVTVHMPCCFTVLPGLCVVVVIYLS